MTYKEEQILIEKKDNIGRKEFVTYIFPKYDELTFKKGGKEEIADMHVTGVTEDGVTHIYTAEIKRRYKYKLNSFKTAILEKKKYDAMLRTYPNRQLFYVMIYDDACVFFNLKLVNQLNLKAEKYQYPKTNQTTKMIEKEVYNIPIEKGIIIYKEE